MNIYKGCAHPKCMDNRVKELRKRSKILSPVLQIGKNGVQDSNIDELKKELLLHELIKIKVFPTALPDDATKSDWKDLAADLAAKTNSLLVDQIGHVVVLYKLRSRHD